MRTFINPMVDWAFKRIFGNKDLLIKFLNSLLEGERVITDLRYLNNERTAEQMEERKVIYDLYCETDTGEFVIIEMQKRLQRNFKDRALYYQARSIVQQAKQGVWDFKLTAVYGVYFINFLLGSDDSGHFCKDVSLVDKHTGKVFNPKFRQIFIEMPRFKKSERECENNLDYWIYNLVNMENLKSISFKDRDAIFARLEEVASRANLTKEEREQLDYEWKIYNDYYNTLDTAMEQGVEKGIVIGIEKGRVEGHVEGRAEGLKEGRTEGRMEEKLSIAIMMKKQGVSTEIIATCTGLSLEEINAL